MKNFPKGGHLQLADSFSLHQWCPLIGENTVLLFCRQSNRNDGFLQKCINFLEQPLKFSHFKGKINKSRYIALFMVIGSIKKLFFFFLFFFIVLPILKIYYKMFFYKNRNTQIQVYSIQRLELETDKICEACSIVHWEGTCRRP